MSTNEHWQVSTGSTNRDGGGTSVGCSCGHESMIWHRDLADDESNPIRLAGLAHAQHVRDDERERIADHLEELEDDRPDEELNAVENAYDDGVRAAISEVRKLGESS